MKTRLLTAAVGIPAALILLVISAYFPAVLCIALFVLCMIGIYEILRVLGAGKEPVVYFPCFIYGAVVMLAPFVGSSSRCISVVAAASLAYLFVMFIILLKKHNNIRLEFLSTSMVLTAFVAFPFMSVELILFNNAVKSASSMPAYSSGVALVAYCLMLSWVADGGAYFVGRAFGKHKLAPVISPKKTIEGSVGGFVASMIISVLAAYIYADVLGCVKGNLNYLNLILLSAICIVISVFGDLSFSAVKRQYGIKDFGNILPGHGGVLDRFDSVLFVCPTFFICHLYIFPLT